VELEYFRFQPAHTVPFTLLFPQLNLWCNFILLLRGKGEISSTITKTINSSLKISQLQVAKWKWKWKFLLLYWLFILHFLVIITWRFELFKQRWIREISLSLEITSPQTWSHSFFTNFYAKLVQKVVSSVLINLGSIDFF